MQVVEILENLKRAVKEYDAKSAADCAREALDNRIDPITAMDAVTEAIRDVGDRFGKGELWLPDLVGAAGAMQSAMDVLEAEIKRIGAKRQSLGTVVIGTGFGDIHNIGKDMVSTLLIAAGFEVHNLGVNIKAEEFLESVEVHNADILAMSALLTTTATEQKKVIDALEEKGIRDKVKVMVGGGSITADFAKSVGADGYDPTAPGAVKLARSLVRK